MRYYRKYDTWSYSTGSSTYGAYSSKTFLEDLDESLIKRRLEKARITNKNKSNNEIFKFE